MPDDLISRAAPLTSSRPKAPARRLDPRAGRQIDLASRADPRRARGRPHARSPACSKARTCCAPPRRCARWRRGRARRGRRSGLVDGVGIGGLAEPDDVLDLGNSGTGARLLMGVVATHPITGFFTGDASLRRRPMARVTEPLSRMGAQFVAREGGRLPLAVIGATDADADRTTRLPVPSAQVKSAVLLAGLNAPGETTVIEPRADARPHRAHAAPFRRDGRGRADRRRRQAHHGRSASPSSAGADRRAGRSVLGGVSRWSRRCSCRARRSRSKASASIRCAPACSRRCARWAPTSPIENRARRGRRAGRRSAWCAPARSRASTCRPSARRRMIDEYPILAVAAAFARGRTVMRGLAELRVKESDRLAAIAQGLAACGVKVAVEGDDADRRGHGQRRRPAARAIATAARSSHRDGVPGAGHGGARRRCGSTTAPPSPPASPASSR